MCLALSLSLAKSNCLSSPLSAKKAAFVRVVVVDSSRSSGVPNTGFPAPKTSLLLSPEYAYHEYFVLGENMKTL